MKASGLMASAAAPADWCQRVHLGYVLEPQGLTMLCLGGLHTGHLYGLWLAGGSPSSPYIILRGLGPTWACLGP